MTEFLIRRLQLQEAAVSECPETPNFEGANHYLGIAEKAGGAFVTPSLRAHVAAELGKESAILKEKRKALEARRGAKGKGAGKHD